ncbi:MAG: flagellar M-ring protein FliF [Fibrobacteria bacterium]|nr:flagellar M-ring protein FliF [Fibrobacteria bacterium]
MDVLREFLARLSEAWSRLGRGQKGILAASALLAFTGLLVLAVWPAMSRPAEEDKKGFTALYRGLDPSEASQIIDGLKASKVEYRLENQGKDILVPRGSVDEQRITFAAQGLPRSGSVGWEIFDKSQLGLTDFVQNINYRRALEGEISRTIAGLGPVEAARVLISIPKPTLFTDREQPPTASVVVKMRAGGELDRRTTKGIAQLIASSVEGLKPQNVTILDQEGKVLNRGGGDDPSSIVEGNADLRSQVEAYLQNKVSDLLDGVVGQGNHRVQVSAEMDFDQIEKTQETYDPDSKVVRSEQTEEESKESSPADGNTTRESRTANYEISRSVVKTVSAPGSVRKRVTVSVAVDGHWQEPTDSMLKADKNAKPKWIPRDDAEVNQLQQLVRNAVGAQDGNDAVFVTCVKFDNPVVQLAMAEMTRRPLPWQQYAWWAVIAIVVVAGIMLTTSLVKILQDAVTPPQPSYADLVTATDQVIEEADMAQEAVRVNDLLSRLENMTKSEPGNFSKLIKNWLGEGNQSDRNPRGG